jgi:DNA-binding transcriptional LysR family regulator
MNKSLRRLDLNLLVTLDALLAENNVTRAAERLHLSQPSVSVQLARLREVFNDPLLLPGPRGMRPTARADALREPLREALESLERAVAPSSPFDPARGASRLPTMAKAPSYCPPWPDCVRQRRDHVWPLSN